MRRHFAIVLCLSSGPLPPLAAQWSIGIDAGVSHFSGTSRDTTAASDPSSLRPHHPTLIGLRIDRGFGRMSVSLGLTYASADLVAENKELGVVEKDLLGLREIAPEITYLLGTTRNGLKLLTHVGPLIDVWLLKEAESRTRLGAHAGVSVEWPVAGRLTGSIRAGAALTGSVFNEGELPPELGRRAMWRRSLSIGLRYRL